MVELATEKLGLGKYPHKIDGQILSVHFSQQLADSSWDDFLQSTPFGQFQQSSVWAQAKRTEGWRPIRAIVNLDGQLSGCFQILYRCSRFGRIGYISKGPVVAPGLPSLADFLCELVARAARAKHLLALVVQPPDSATWYGPLLMRYGFVDNHLIEVISATLLVDLTRSIGEIGRRIRKSTQAEIRQAERRGIKIREGNEKDIGTFFHLMLSTCERQKTKPAPSTEAALFNIWKTFRSRGCARLSIAEYEGEPIAGIICLAFGERVTGWKKGWSGQHRDRHPNPLLIYDAVEWSHRNGYKLFDFAALSPDIATTLLRGAALSENQKKSRDFLHLNFGDRPVMLPDYRLYIPNPFVRFAYRSATANSGLRVLAKHLVRIGRNCNRRINKQTTDHWQASGPVQLSNRGVR